VASCTQAIGAVLIEPALGVSSLGWGLAFGLTAIANIFLYAFMLQIFSTGTNAGGVRFKVFVIVEAIVAVLLPFAAPLSQPPFSAMLQSVFTIVLYLLLVVHLSFSIALYIALIKVTTASIRKTTNAMARRGFSLIRLAGFTIILSYTCFVLDRLWQYTFEPEGYTIFVIFGWVFAGFTGVLLYLGFVLPRRLRQDAK
jgi:hypothetical protein